LRVRAIIVLIPLLVFANGCAVAPEYNAVAYKNATDLKVEALDLMSEGTNRYYTKVTEVKDLKENLEKAYEYANGLPNNQITSAMWLLIKSPDQPLLGGYLEFWRARGILSSEFVDEQKIQVAEAFDYLICLEANKKSISNCNDKKPPARN
jgi:hypothetical protein